MIGLYFISNFQNVVEREVNLYNDTFNSTLIRFEKEVIYDKNGQQRDFKLYLFVLEQVEDEESQVVETPISTGDLEEDHKQEENGSVKNIEEKLNFKKKGDISIDNFTPKLRTLTTLASTQYSNSPRNRMKESMVISYKKYQSSKSSRFNQGVYKRKNQNILEDHDQQKKHKNNETSIRNHKIPKNISDKNRIESDCIIFSSVYIEPELCDLSEFNEIVKYKTTK